MMSHVACCNTLVHHEGQHLWQPTTDELIARKHLEEAYQPSVEYIFNPVLHGHAALGVCMAQSVLLAWEDRLCRVCFVKHQNANTVICCCVIR